MAASTRAEISRTFVAKTDRIKALLIRKYRLPGSATGTYLPNKVIEV